jgi:hypothetical protein
LTLCLALHCMKWTGLVLVYYFLARQRGTSDNIYIYHVRKKVTTTTTNWYYV